MSYFKAVSFAAVGSSLVTAGAIQSSGIDLIFGIVVLIINVLPYEKKNHDN